MVRFKLDVNLDDEQELDEFWSAYGKLGPRALANRLGFRGPNSLKAAVALHRYAYRKRKAILLRRKGWMAQALKYEGVCDDIYRKQIRPFIECW